MKETNTKPCKHIKNVTTHGMSNTRLFNTWVRLKQKCYNSNDSHYKYYGSRGIVVYQEWLDDFMNFYNWAMENGYRDDLTIDRIDVDGNYEPDNCRWVDMKIQCNNRRNTKYITYNGKTQTISQWCDELNLPYKRVIQRHYRGWSDKDCLFGRSKYNM